MSKAPWYPECSGAVRKHGTIEPQTDKARQFYEIGRQCLCCDKYMALNGDYGVCLMPMSPHFGVVVFEHFSCESHIYSKQEAM